MNRRLERMYQRAFQAAFLRLRDQGVSEDTAIALAESEAQEGLDRYCDDKLEERKIDGDRRDR